MFRFSPLPAGCRFGMSFVDDTDLSTRENTEPVYRHLADLNFWGTKTVWPLRARRTSSFKRSTERQVPEPGSGATLEDADYADFVRSLADLGFEIALHGVAAGNSSRQEIERGLELFRSVLGRLPDLNAFHRTNIENLYCGPHKLDSWPLRTLERLTDSSEYEGHQVGAPAFWGDIALETFRYVRLPFHTIDDINTLRVNPSMPFADSRRPFVRRWFAQSDGGDVVRFNRLLSDAHMRRLIDERGICLIYTHFAKGFARRSSTGCTLDDGFVRTVARVCSTPGGWFTTATAMLDRLSATNSLGLRQVGQDVQIENGGETAAVNIVMQLPDGASVRRQDGQPLEPTDNGVVLPTLQAGEVLSLTVDRPGSLSILPRAVDVSRRERRRVEYANYLGLLRSAVRDRAHYRREAAGKPSRAR